MIRLASSKDASSPIVATFFVITWSIGVSSGMSLATILMASRSVKIPTHLLASSVIITEPTCFSCSILDGLLGRDVGLRGYHIFDHYVLYH